MLVTAAGPLFGLSAILTFACVASTLAQEERAPQPRAGAAAPQAQGGNPSPARVRPPAPPANSLAEPGRPGWSVDARNGCWVWNAHPQPGETVSWSGACPRGPAQGQGQGEWRWTEGGQPRVQRFSGTRREGRMEGRGTYTWANGARYEGEYRDDRRHGRGTQTWANGYRYEGEWRDGRADGYGEYYDAASGIWYRGQWTGGCHRGANGRAAIDRPLSECP
jgi:hypothetical protein